MRIFAFLLSIFITALAIVPCADGMPQSSVDTEMEVFASEHDHNHSDQKDDCTPFCICVCCGSLIALPSLQPFLNERVAISAESLSRYTFDYSFDYSEGIWHPPSLS